MFGPTKVIGCMFHCWLLNTFLASGKLLNSARHTCRGQLAIFAVYYYRPNSLTNGVSKGKCQNNTLYKTFAIETRTREIALNWSNIGRALKDVGTVV